jgi:predicted AAA+ superfamily ATPase
LEILEDNLVGYRLLAFDRSVRKRQMKNPKFYFFDLGVQSALQKQLHVALEPQTYAYGKAFLFNNFSFLSFID